MLIMCLNRIKVFNPALGRFLLVDCGHCFSCMNKKAKNNCLKIMSDYEVGYNYYFVTFTYDNGHVPYVHKGDLKVGCFDIPFYRGADLIDTVHLELPLTKKQFDSITGKQYLRKFPFVDCFGVLYYKDFQDFLKRFRKHAKNSFTFSYYAVSEYGETFFRPHFHVLFKTSADFDTFRSAVVKDWKMCLWESVPRAFEYAINPASYISQYLTLNTDLPLFYQIPSFAPTKSHSLHFGQARNCFNLPSVFSLAEKHTLVFNLPKISEAGVTLYTPVPLPKYILYRYFPNFKGLSKLTYNEFLRFCKSFVGYDPRNAIYEQYPQTSSELKKGKLPQYSGFSFQYSDYLIDFSRRYHIDFSLIDKSKAKNYWLYELVRRMRLTTSDYRTIINCLNRVYRYSQSLNVSYDYYLMIWYNVRVNMFSDSFKNSFNGMSFMDFKHFYFNFDDLINMRVRAPTLDSLFELSSLDEFSAISCKDLVNEHDSKERLIKFSKNNKQKTFLQ